MNQANRVQTAQNNQKILFVSRPQTPGGGLHQVQQNPTSQQNTVVKFVSNANTINAPKMVNAQQKLVVVGMQTSTPSPTSMSNPGTYVTQSGIQSGGMMNQGGGNQPPISVVPKASFIQQKVKSDNVQQALVVDDLSHLAW